MAIIKPSSPVFNPNHPLSKGLILAWLLSDKGGQATYDSGPFRRTGTISGTPTWVPAGMQVAPDAHTATTNIIIPTDNFTATLHITDAARVDAGGILIMAGASGATNGWTLEILSTTWQIRRAGIAWINTGNSNITGTHVITIIRAGLLWQVWLDGIQILTPTAGTINTPTNRIAIGSPVSAASSSGTHHSFLYYDRVLNGNEIQALHRDPYAAFRPPITRIGLSIAAPSTTTVALTWTDNSVGETGYSIERSTDGINYSEIGTAAADATSYNDETAALATTYYYRVKATGSPADSDYSNVATITTA